MNNAVIDFEMKAKATDVAKALGAMGWQVRGIMSRAVRSSEYRVLPVADIDGAFWVSGLKFNVSDKNNNLLFVVDGSASIVDIANEINNKAV